MEEKHTYIMDHLGDLPKVVEEMLPVLQKAKIITLTGDLGAGKTTLVKEICAQLGIDDLVSSPTFSIINEYEHAESPLKVYHMDLYRIKDEEELFNIGFEDYLFSGDFVFIEWPQISERLLPSETIAIHIMIFDNSSRRLILSSNT